MSFVDGILNCFDVDDRFVAIGQNMLCNVVFGWDQEYFVQSYDRMDLLLRYSEY